MTEAGEESLDREVSLWETPRWGETGLCSKLGSGREDRSGGDEVEGCRIKSSRELGTWRGFEINRKLTLYCLTF